MTTERGLDGLETMPDAFEIAQNAYSMGCEAGMRRAIDVLSLEASRIAHSREEQDLLEGFWHAWRLLEEELRQGDVKDSPCEDSKSE